MDTQNHIINKIALFMKKTLCALLSVALFQRLHGISMLFLLLTGVFWDIIVKVK